MPRSSPGARSLEGEHLALAELVRRLYVALGNARKAHLRRFGITHLDFMALTTLLRSESMPLSALATSLRLSKPAMSRTLGRLLARELVVAAREATDRRVLRVSLTPMGKAHGRGVLSMERGLEAALVKRLLPSERRRLRDVLLAVLADAESVASRG